MTLGQIERVAEDVLTGYDCGAPRLTCLVLRERKGLNWDPATTATISADGLSTTGMSGSFSCFTRILKRRGTRPECDFRSDMNWDTTFWIITGSF